MKDRELLISKIEEFVKRLNKWRGPFHFGDPGYLFLHIQEDDMVKKTKFLSNDYGLEEILDECDYVFFKEGISCDNFKDWIKCPVCLERCHIICLNISNLVI